jgi:hypothetical protein
MQNPFNVTKASEYSDEQINRYWVNIGDKEVLNPQDYTPKYILGGKGCGKTHLLRYYSYPLQRLRSGSIEDVLAKDKYIGIYSVFSTMDASRFEGKNVPDGQWTALFKYYFELYISSFVLKYISEFIETEKGKAKEVDFVTSVMDLFLKKISIESYKLKTLLDLVESERKNIDFQIENVAFTGNFNNVQINLKPGSLIFGIPEVLRKIYSDFENVEFIYIMDEYEKLVDWQKRYVNTLVWEKRYPSTFWIGARKYGYTDMHTETGEELKKGSEYNPFFMDIYYQYNEKAFESFALELINKRLMRDDKEAVVDLAAKFKNGKDEAISLIKTSKKGNYKHFKNLSNEIKLSIKRGIVPENEEDIQIVLNNIKADTDDNPLEQKYKLYLFYQMWADRKTKSLVEISESVKNEYSNYKKGKDSKYSNIVEKYKSDFIAQLCEENGEEYYAFSGLDDFIKLAWGNPRVLLLLLKKTIEKAQVFQEHPLDSGGQISLRAQYIGIKETAQWYLEDAELTGTTGSYINTAINNLAQYFRLYRFSDKPTDTSVCAFNYGTEDISHNAADLIRMMELHSLLVKVDNERKQKNSGKAEKTYQLNRILAPNWNLPSARRGIADFSSNVIEAIFNHDSFGRFNSEYVMMKNRMNAPFVKKDSNNMELEFEQ